MVPTSLATRAATEVAATRLGWVQAITLPGGAQPDSYRYWGSSGCKYGNLQYSNTEFEEPDARVVFPQPVSPTTMTTPNFSMQNSNLSPDAAHLSDYLSDGYGLDILCLKIGNASRCAIIPKELELGCAWTMLSSDSVALSRELPGPWVPGFQNWTLVAIEIKTFRLR